MEKEAYSVTNTELAMMIAATHGMFSYTSSDKIHEALIKHFSYLLDVQKRRAYLSGMSEPTEMELDKMDLACLNQLKKKIKKA